MGCVAAAGPWCTYCEGYRVDTRNVQLFKTSTLHDNLVQSVGLAHAALDV